MVKTRAPSAVEYAEMSDAGFDWEPTDAGYPRWIHRAKDIYCVHPPHVNDEQWEELKKRRILESQLDMPPSFFARLGQPCCSRWGNSETEWITQAYMQALANDGDVWKQLSPERVCELLSQEQMPIVRQFLRGGNYLMAFERVRAQIVSSDGAFAVGGFWHRGRALP